MSEKNIEDILTDDEVKLEEINKIYTYLINQRDSVKSTTLCNVLNQEISAYVNLTKTFGEYSSIYAHRISEDLNRTSEYLKQSLEMINEIDDKEIAFYNLKHVQSTYETMQKFDMLELGVFEFTKQNFLQAVSRDFKDWKEFATSFAKETVGAAADAIPVISEVKGILEGIVTVADLINEYESNGTDYSEVDKRLMEIELHTEVMVIANSILMQSVNLLKESEQPKEG